MAEKEEGTGQTAPSEETVEISTSRETGFKMSKAQTALLIFALCVRNLKFLFDALVTK